MQFSEEILKKAIRSASNELAWQRADVFNAIEQLTQNDYAILGGDVWAITSNNTSLQPLAYIDKKHIAIGIIKGKDGHDYVYEWHADKLPSESWAEYVLRSKVSSIAAIKQLNAEETVAEEFKERIFYNLVYVSSQEYLNLNAHTT